jgi:hypothetical protein
MGLTRVRMKVTPVERSRPAREIDFLVDSGAVTGTLGLVLDPLSREVLPMRLTLARR